MSPTKKRKVNQEPGSPSSQDSEPSLSDVEEAIRIYTYKMERKIRLKEQSGTIKELQGKLRRTECELKDLKEAYEGLKTRLNMMRDLHFKTKKELNILFVNYQTSFDKIYRPGSIH